MITRDPGFLRMEPGQQGFPGGGRAIGNLIHGGAPIRMLEGDDGMGQCIADYHRSVIAGRDLDRDVARGMASRINDGDARRNVIAWLERFDFLLDCSEAFLCAYHKALAILRDFRNSVFVVPIIPFHLGNVVAGVWEGRFIEVVDDAP